MKNLVFTVTALATIVVAPAQAGDRQLGVIFVNMTPDALSTEPSKTCAREIEAVIKDDYSVVTRMGETKMRGRVKKTAGESFLEWPEGVFDGARDSDADYVDAIVLVDCRPEEKTVDIVIGANGGAHAIIKVRGLELDKKASKVIGQAILRRAWANFSP